MANTIPVPGPGPVPVPVPRSVPGPVPVPLLGPDSDSIRDCSSTSSSGACPFDSPSPLPLANILRDFNDIDDSEEDEIDNNSHDILVNFDSDKESNISYGDDHPESESQADDEENEDDDNHSSGGDHGGPVSHKPGERYTEMDFHFLDEEWLQHTNETSEEDFSTTASSDYN